MASTINATVDIRIKGQEIITDTDGSVIETQNFDLLTATQTYGANSSPAGSKRYALEQQLTAGALTLDLTSLAGKTFNGLKLRAIQIEPAATNTSGVSITKGASNGYQWSGGASDILTIPAGCNFGFNLKDKLGAVGGSAKTLDFASSDTDALFNIILLAG